MRTSIAAFQIIMRMDRMWWGVPIIPHCWYRVEFELQHISESNVGSKMLKAMGWKKGEGLGKDGKGITAPVQVCALLCAVTLTNLLELLSATQWLLIT
jgi:hypothetical protein